MRLVWGTVGVAGAPEAGAQRVTVVLDGSGTPDRAVAYPNLTGP